VRLAAALLRRNGAAAMEQALNMIVIGIMLVAIYLSLERILR
jgi:hypothetical protein